MNPTSSSLEANIKAKIHELDHVANHLPLLMDGETIARFAELCMDLLAMQASIVFTTHEGLEAHSLVKQIAVALERAQDQLYARKNSRDYLAAQTQHLIH